jgi:hypothetical protein
MGEFLHEHKVWKKEKRDRNKVLYEFFLGKKNLGDYSKVYI